MAEAVISLLLKANNQASGALNQVSKDIAKQKAEIKSLQAAEQARIATQRSALAQSKLVAAQDAQNASASLKNQKVLEQAQSAAARAANQAQIAQKRHALSLQDTGQEAGRASTALQKVGAAASAAGGVAAAGLNRLLSVLQSIATTALSVGAGLAAIGTAGLAAGLKGAASAEMQNVLAKNNIAGALGGDRVAAGAFIKQQNAAITAGAGGLINTGLSKEFANIFADDIVKAFGTGQASAEMTAGIANRFSGLSDFAGVDKGMMKNAITDFFSGSMTGDMLQGRDAFIDANLVKPLQEEIAKSGKALQDLSPAERIKVMDAALKKALTSDGLQEMANTAEGQMKILNNRLFGENGLLSTVRDTLPDVEGNQSVFEEFKKSLGLLFNSDGLFAQLGRILNASGINTDVMQRIRNGWDRFNKFLTGFNNFLSKAGNLDQLINNLQWELKQVGGFTGLGQKVGEKINEAIEKIDAEGIGKLIADGFNFIGGLFDRLDKGMIIRKIGEGLGSLMSNLTWQGWAASVGLLVGGPAIKLVSGFVLGAIKQALTDQVAAQIAARVGAGSAAKGTAAAGAAPAAVGGGGGVLAAGGGVLAGAGGLMLAASQLNKAFKAKGMDSSGEGISKSFLSFITGNQGFGAIQLAQAIGPEDRQKLINALVSPIKQLIPIAEQTGQTVRQVATESSGMIQQSLGSAGTSAQQKWGEISSNVSNWASNTGSVVQSNASNALTQAQSGWTQISSNVSNWASNTSNAVQTNATNALTQAQTKWGEISTAVSTWCSNTQSAIAEKTASMLERAGSAWESIKSTISSLWDQIKSVIESAKSVASSVDLAGAVSGLMESINSAIASARSRVQNFWDRVTGGGGDSQGASYRGRIPSPSPSIVSGRSSYSTSSYTGVAGGIHLNVYPSPGMNEERLADLVISRLNDRIRRERLALGM